MTYKRQLWTSGYEYRLRCPFCGTYVSYSDRQLGFRSWYPNGFVYCPRCRKPIPHNEIFAVHPDGTPVYKTQQEANAAITEGYFSALGVNVAPPDGQQYRNASGNGVPPADQSQPPRPGDANVAFCTACGRQYEKGRDSFCPGCGKKLNETE